MSKDIPLSELQVSVASLEPHDKDGYLTKQGGAIKTWKRRWFVLKGSKLWYFKSRTDTQAKGFIELEATTLVREEGSNNKKKKTMFSIQARGLKGRRVFMMYPDTQQESTEWIEAIRKNIAACSSGGFSGPEPTAQPQPAAPAPVTDPNQIVQTEPAPLAAGAGPTAAPVPTATAAPVLDASSVRARVFNARTAVPFLREDESKVLEFWQIWRESIPLKSEMSPGQSMEFIIATSAEMDKLTWRVSGPQNIFIQKMVDFFWNVGAPETEIDRLNDVGALINPVKIGSWIDMSSRCGMDGGWFFPVDIEIKAAIEAADAGDPTHRVMQWIETNNVTRCFSVGRDMGAAPPRQTELRLVLPGADAASQLMIAQNAFASFEFPAIPAEMLSLISDYQPPEPYCLSIVTSSEGFVRIGLLIPRPPRDLIGRMADACGGRRDAIDAFANTVGCEVPQYAEYQYLMKGYGYNVYKEGFDVMFHWNIGEEFA